MTFIRYRLGMIKRSLLRASLCLLVPMACKKEQANITVPVDEQEAVDTHSEETNDGVSDKKNKRPEEVLLKTAVERRLYSNRIEASSFAWGNYNRFHENYHPKYLMDGDPKTTWLEDVPGNGKGEWIRVATSPITDATKLRLRMQNGYHKSESLFKKNSRIRAMEVKVLPNGPTKHFDLPDSMDWQELAIDFDPQRVEGLEMKMLDAYAGSKYEDLCVSELEVYVTGRTPENPTFEAKKLAEVQAWKEGRLTAAKMFAGATAGELPIKSAYNVVKGEKYERVGESEVPYEVGDSHPVALRMLATLSKLNLGDKALVERAKASITANFEGWTHLRPVVKNPMVWPDVDGLVLFRRNRDRFDVSSVFEMPAIGKRKSLANNRRIALFESKPMKISSDDSCKKGQVLARRPLGAKGPNANELLIWHCVEADEREGVYRYRAWKLLEYDEGGWLRLAVGQHSAVVFDWKNTESGVVLVSADRVARWTNQVAHLQSIEDVVGSEKKKK